VLAVVVVVLAVKLGDDGGGKGKAKAAPTDNAALATRLDVAERNIASLRKTIVGLGRELKADLARTTKQPAAQVRRTQRLESCIVQLQDEVDDLQTYLTYGTPPRTTRVSGACLNLLKPRYRR
jgi:hypothetical protein